MKWLIAVLLVLCSASVFAGYNQPYNSYGYSNYNQYNTNPEYYHTISYGDQYGQGYVIERQGTDYSSYSASYHPYASRGCMGSGCRYFNQQYGGNYYGSGDEYYGNYCGSYWCDRYYNDHYNAVYYNTRNDWLTN